MNRIEEVLKSIENDIANEKIKHVGVQMVCFNGRLGVKFYCIDNERYAAKVDEIVERYCEELTPARILKTTRIYTF